MDNSPPVHVVLLTPPGRGAVATVRVEGPGAGGLVDPLFRADSGRPLAELASHRLALGRFRLGEDVYDEVLVRRPGENAVEIHCHGGGAVVERLIGVLGTAGARPVSPQQWLSAVCPSPIAAAAHDQLGRATTLRGATILLDQYRGALDRALEQILGDLQRGQLKAAAAIQGLLDAAPCGCHLARPWQLVLAGPPNVGKSSLVNALVGYRRALVHEKAGTTRDLVTVATALDGWPVELCDTAGLRETQHAVERQGIELAHRRLESASLVLLILDASAPWTPQDAELCRRLPDAVRIFNKQDLPKALRQPPVEGLAVSALDGAGIDQLIAEISRRLVPAPPAPGQPVPFLEDQVDSLRLAAEAVRQGHWSQAVRHVAGLLGR